MKLVAITQRVDSIPGRIEKRDALDQNWFKLLQCAGYTTITLPNNHDIASALITNLKIQGVIFSGGNDLMAYGGDSPERDDMEFKLLEYVIKNGIPALGVCRGMQLFQHHWNIKLEQVTGHICSQQKIFINHTEEAVNSYHNWGAFSTTPAFKTIAISSDNVIKGIQHEVLPITGIMWHPERILPFRKKDINLIKQVFG